MPGTCMSSEEVRLAQMWFHADNKTPAEIAQLLHRSKSTLTRLLVKRAPRAGRGRHRLLSDAAVARLVQKLEELIREAEGKYEVTVSMLRRHARVKAK